MPKRNLLSAWSLGCAMLALLPLALAGQTPPSALSNGHYQVRLLTDGAVEVAVKGATPRRFTPTFTILARADEPGLSRESPPDKVEYMPVPNWKSARSNERTWDFFAAAEKITIKADRAKLNGGKVRWLFPPHAQFRLEAELSLSATQGASEPLITYRFTPEQEGWYTVGYTGAPELQPSELEEIWQPLIWQERRFPRQSFFSAEDMCPLPATFVTSKGVTVGVAADPSESPFRLPIPDNSRFGVLVRNERGQAQPMVFAPVFGGAASRMKSGAAFEFKLRLYVHAGSAFESYKHLARGLYGFRDYRENASCSLNETLENMLAFALNDQYSGWVADLRGFDYTTDVSQTVKVVSALHPLSLALLTDNEEIYRRRALPIIEYLMSRQKYLFTADPGETGQSASHLLRGPSAEISELAALNLFSQRRSEVFRYYAETLLDKPRTLNLEVVSAGASWQSLLALYRLTGEAKYLSRAQAGADRHIAERVAKPHTDFSQINPQTGHEFWVDYTPKWIDLLELYEETKERRYLDAAAVGARLYTNYVWLQPRIPEGNYTVNKGGKVIVAGYFPHLKIIPQPMEAPEQSVPAWRVAQIGLTPEASSTYTINPAVFLTHYAAHFLRIAYYTGDSFFRDIARSAVVGRYANFPGYDINGEYTTVYERPDYPLHPWEQLTYNNIYYNHVWPHIALVTDYLLTDVFTRSQGRIEFPPRYAEGYAYLKSKVYGDRAGKFYDDQNVRLWMPAKLLRADQIQANYVAGYGNGNFYLALMNQSAQPINVKIRLNPDVAPFDVTRTFNVRVWQENKPVGATTLRRGEVSVPIAARGITALAVDGMQIAPLFQAKVFGSEAAKLTPGSHAEITTPFGKVTGMLISFGRTLTSSYIWLEATEKELKETRLHYRVGGGWEEVVDAHYPFEFSLPLEDSGASFEYWVEGVKPDGTRTRSAPAELKR
jgi:hypothetical protein